MGHSSLVVRCAVRAPKDSFITNHTPTNQQSTNTAALPPLDENNNLAFFVPFHTGAAGGGHLAIRVLIVVLATTMSQSAVDSLQNAINANLSSTLLAGRPVAWSRALVFLVNVPIVALALQRFALLDLFLAMNVLTTTAAAPLLSGLWLPRVSGATVLLSSFGALACTCALGVAVQYEKGRGPLEGIRWVFTSSLNNYDFKIFVVAALSSVAFTLALWFLWDTRGKGLELLAEARLAQQARREAARAGGAAGQEEDEGEGIGSRSSSLRQPFLSRCPCPLSGRGCARRGGLRDGGARGSGGSGGGGRRHDAPHPLKVPTVAASSTSSLAAMLPAGSRGGGSSSGGQDTESSACSRSPTLSPEHSLRLGDDEEDEEMGEWMVEAGTYCEPPAAQRIENQGEAVGLDMA